MWLRYCLLAVLLLCASFASTADARSWDTYGFRDNELEPRDPIIYPDDTYTPPVQEPEPTPTPTPEPEPTPMPTQDTGGVIPSVSELPPLDEIVGDGAQTAVDFAEDVLDSVEDIATAIRDMLRADDRIDISEGGALSVGAQNVLVYEHGICRWLDNESVGAELLVPYRTSAEWQAFLDNAPAGVTRAGCCPAATAMLTSSDGQSVSFELDIGRDGALNSLGRRMLSHTFTLGAGGTETVRQIYVCTGDAWVGEGVVRTSDPGDETTEPTTEENDPVTPDGPADVCYPASSRDVKVTWTGQWRRGWSGNATFTKSGIGRVQQVYMNADGTITSNGSGDRSTAIFNLEEPIADADVKVTAVYGSYSGDLNGGPGPFSRGEAKVAEFHIASGQNINLSNTPATGIFYSRQRMGRPFMMTNNAIYMPSYDSSPNLKSLTVEYTKDTGAAEVDPSLIPACTPMPENFQVGIHAYDGDRFEVEFDLKTGTAQLIFLNYTRRGTEYGVGKGWYASIPTLSYDDLCEGSSTMDIGSANARLWISGDSVDGSVDYIVTQKPTCENGLVGRVAVDDTTNGWGKYRHPVSGLFTFPLTRACQCSNACTADQEIWGGACVSKCPTGQVRNTSTGVCYTPVPVESNPCESKPWLCEDGGRVDSDGENIYQNLQ